MLALAWLLRGCLPFTTLALLGFGVGAASAAAGASELRVSPRPALLSDSFGAFAAFLLLLLLPISVYFYVFHGDWFMLYTVDVRGLPSALVVLGFVAQAGLGLLGFVSAGLCVRSGHVSWAIAIALTSAFAAIGIVFVCPERLRVTGSFRQFWGGFGLEPYGGALFQGALAMGAFLLFGTVYLLARIHRSQTRLQRP